MILSYIKHLQGPNGNIEKRELGLNTSLVTLRMLTNEKSYSIPLMCHIIITFAGTTFSTSGTESG